MSEYLLAIIAVLVLLCLFYCWKREGFVKCNSEVGERTLLSMVYGAEGAPAC